MTWHPESNDSERVSWSLSQTVWKRERVCVCQFVCISVSSTWQFIARWVRIASRSNFASLDVLSSRPCLLRYCWASGWGGQALQDCCHHLQCWRWWLISWWSRGNIKTDAIKFWVIPQSEVIYLNDMMINAHHLHHSCCKMFHLSSLHFLVQCDLFFKTFYRLIHQLLH